jgi:hypothetical protein
MSLSDILGREVTHIESSGNATVKIGNHLCAGIYYVAVKSENELSWHKIIKIK